MAQTITIMTDLKDITSPVVVSSCNSTPAPIKPNDGGATPDEMETKKWVNIIIKVSKSVKITNSSS